MLIKPTKCRITEETNMFRLLYKQMQKLNQLNIHNYDVADNK
jgi:hypothetical protein